MTKVVIEIKDKKDTTNDCTVTIKPQGLEKGTENEKQTTAIIYNTVCEAIKNLN